MIRKNDVITELSLIDDKIGETIEGAKQISKIIGKNCILKKLNLSGNGFSDKNVKYLVEALEVS
jgi:hypothetical protein